MRRFSLIFVIAIVWSLLVSCAPPASELKTGILKNYDFNMVTKRVIGEPLVSFAHAYQDFWAPPGVLTASSYKEELIYTGRSGSTIHIAYREYKQDFARPAFFHDLQYDLSQSNLIAYRGYRIKVMDATNEEITFIVLADGHENDKWGE